MPKILISLSIFIVLIVLNAVIKQDTFQEQRGPEGSTKSFTAPAEGRELLPPLHVDLTITETNPRLGEVITVILDFFVKSIPSESRLSRVNVNLQARNLQIVGQDSFIINNIPVGVNQKIEVPVRIISTGKAQFIASVEAFNDSGKKLFGNSASIYLLVFTDQIFTGKGSFQELEIKKTEEDYQNGLITENEFNKKMEDASKGNPSVEIRRIR